MTMATKRTSTPAELAPSHRSQPQPSKGRRVPRHAGLLALGSLLALAAAALVACAGNPVAALAIGAAPEKVAKTDDHNPGTAAALAAFREALTAGAYDRLPALRTQLTAAYLENPRHPVVALYLGMAHLWTMSESTRMNPSPPTVTDHAVLANKYLSEAARLAPADLRIAGFVASTELALGAIHQDEKLTRKGYFAMLDAAKAKPDFNGFTASYVLSRAVHGDPSSLPGLIEQMWRAGRLPGPQSRPAAARSARRVAQRPGGGAARQARHLLEHRAGAAQRRRFLHALRRPVCGTGGARRGGGDVPQRQRSSQLRQLALSRAARDPHRRARRQQQALHRPAGARATGLDDDDLVLVRGLSREGQGIDAAGLEVGPPPRSSLDPP
jgi:hypothetical protein